jgi:hypothetical protein
LDEAIYEQPACWAMAFAGRVPGVPGGGDQVHPAAAYVGVLLGDMARTTVLCPRSGEVGPPVDVLDHLLRHHGVSYQEAAEWLEAAEPDLFAVAVHYLAGKARREASAPAVAVASAMQSGMPTPL